jgi:hypothetical protein
MRKDMRTTTSAAWRRRGAWLLALCASVSVGRAAFDCEVDYVNPWLDTNGLAGVFTNAIPHSTVCYHGHSGPYVPPGGYPAATMSDGTFQLDRSALGLPFAEAMPDAAIGDVIAPPAGALTNHPPVALYPTNGAFFVLSTGQLVASAHGSVSVQWQMANNSTITKTYTIAAVASQRPQRLFWTEAPYYAPSVLLSGKFARIHYNDDILPPVVTTNIVVNPTAGVTNVVITTNCSATVWIADNGGSKSILANGCAGSFVLELFDSGSFSRQIGWEVVQVMAPDIIYQDVTIGQRLLPQDTYYGVSGLQPQITDGATADGSETLYLHASSDGMSPMEGWLYAIYQTVEDPWDAEVYWMHTGVAGIMWPWEVDQYATDWPADCQVMAYAPAGQGTSAPVLIPASLHPQLMPMQTPIRNFTLNNNASAGVLSAQADGLALLQYSDQKEQIWFQVVRAVAHDNPVLYELTPVPWDVGRRLGPAVAPTALALRQQTWLDLGYGPTVLGRNPTTVELWANIHTNGGVLFAAGDTNLGPACLYLQPRSVSGGDVTFAAGAYGVAATNLVLPGSLNAWHHYALTYDAVNLALFYDGVQVAAWPAILDTTAAPFYAGDKFAAPPGGVDEDRADILGLRIWSEARTSEQLQNHMYRNLGAQELLDANLLACYPLYANGGAAALDFARGYVAAIGSPGGYVSSSAPVAFDLSPWSGYPGFLYSGRSYNPHCYAYPMQTNNPASLSAIFAVHTNSPLEVWWANAYQASGMPEAIYWPSLVARYQPQWPTNVPTLVLAHQTEESNALPDQALNPGIYYQNDVSQIGFNPNEEHALILGNALYAIRNDLNNPALPDSSAPVVLVEYTDGTGAPAMQAYSVVATNSEYDFNYPLLAPNRLEPMAPLSFLANPNCSNTVPFGGPAWRDRNRQYWAYRAGLDGVSAETVKMNWCYQNQPGFYYPGESPQPVLGQEIPFLSGQGSRGQPRPVTYTITWPDNLPPLHTGDTLVKPNQQQVGLPDIADQLSVDILFQQSLPYAYISTNYTTASGVQVVPVQEYPVDTVSSSVVLIDPTRIRASASTAKFALPALIKQQASGARVYFPDLPPQLNQRLYWQQTQDSPPAGQLFIFGQNVVPPLGLNYLLLNLLGADEQAAALSLSTDANWRAAINGLPTDVYAITNSNMAADSLALCAGIGRGRGYVTVAFNNGDGVPPGTPISLACLNVLPPLVTGEVKAITPADVLNEQTTMRHTTDCAGHPENYRFEWRYNGSDSTSSNYDDWLYYISAAGANQITFGSGQPMFTLSDNFFVCRYQSLDPLNPAGTNWSAWTQPMIAESWVKRSMNAINPYNQRITTYQSNLPDYTINMIALAGEPYLGDVALNPDKLNDFGLIEIYWTIFNRARNMAAALPNGGDQGINDTLRYAATRLNALYVLLGNEAYADAQDPTIGFGTQSDWDAYGDYITRASSLFCFMNLEPTLLDEELALLRGRDDRLDPGVREAPTYNRLIWNFSRGIDGGELAYALNYGIADAQGNVSGTMSEDDAKTLYPQGHGDAWGHYLSALKLYYLLLHTTNYVWIADSTAMDLGGVTVEVGYYDEEKFAETAAARARVGLDVASRTFQQTYQSEPAGLWAGYRDSDTNRCWATGDWAVRAGQGAYFDWLTVNSLLPTKDTDSTHSGIQVIDRSTVRALGEVSTAINSLQTLVDGADGGLNPLGLAGNVMPFDISPAGIDAGQSHFDQIYDRALAALNNAQTTLDHAQGAAQRLRRQATSFNNYVTDTVGQNEQNARNRLLQIFGTPYADDIGPGKTYADGYDGPDLYHFSYVDLDSMKPLLDGFTNTVTVGLPSIPANFSADTATWRQLSSTTQDVTFCVDIEGAFGKPASWTGVRSQPGEYQAAKLAYLQGMVQLQERIIALKSGIAAVDLAIQAFNSFQHAQVEAFAYTMSQDSLFLLKLAAGITAKSKSKVAQSGVETHLLNSITRQLGWTFTEGWVEGLITGLADGDITGTTSDLGSDARKSSSLTARGEVAEGQAVTAVCSKIADGLDLMMGTMQRGQATYAQVLTANTAISARLLEVQGAIGRLLPLVEEVRARNVAVSELAAKLDALGAAGTDQLAQLAAQRAAGAWRVQNARYADMTLRLFRDESLRQYSDAFALAARYACLAASAYDYETTLLRGDPTGTAGSQFMDRFLRTRSLGAVVNGQPVVAAGYGDAGLADGLARMKANWDVLKGRLGFNNPDTETSRFSLRTELFRIAPGSASDSTWQNLLQTNVVDLMTIPEYRAFCRTLATPGATNEPGIMITFSTTITPGQNFFGCALAGGDNAYSSTRAATKIRSVGVWFTGYTNTFNTGMANAPQVYLIPVGADRMRSPIRGGEQVVRTWNVFDQALPVPYQVSAADLNAPNWIPYFDSLSENFAASRRFAALRAYHDSGNFTPAELCTNARLIGRSVWNTRWMLLIPGRTLLADPVEGINRFILGPMNSGGASGRTMKGVTDIKLFFNTYSIPGE